MVVFGVSIVLSRTGGLVCWIICDIDECKLSISLAVRRMPTIVRQPWMFKSLDYGNALVRIPCNHSFKQIDY